MGRRKREHKRKVLAGEEPLYRGMPDKDKPAVPIFVAGEEKTAMSRMAEQEKPAVEDEPATDESTRRLVEAMKRLRR